MLTEAWAAGGWHPATQREFTDTFSPAHTIRLSSAGLVYRYGRSMRRRALPPRRLSRRPRSGPGPRWARPRRHYGKEAIAGVLGIAVDDERMPLLYSKVYEVGPGSAATPALAATDAWPAAWAAMPPFPGAHPRHGRHRQRREPVPRRRAAAVPGAHGPRGSRRSPQPGVERQDHRRGRTRGRSRRGAWGRADADAESPARGDGAACAQAQFARAVEIAGEDFVSIVKYLGNAWLPARAIVERSLRNRHQTHASGRIVLLEEQCPWKVRRASVG